MIFQLSFIMSVGIDGAFWRAVFVAALALTAFALTRYWQSLSKHSQQTRLLLVALRGVALVLLACALVGLRFEYDSTHNSRVLVRQARAHQALDEASRNPSEAVAIKQALAALTAKNFEAVEQTEPTLAAKSAQHASYLATLLVTGGDLPAETARREIERASAEASGAPVFVLTDLREDDSPRVALESVAVMGKPVRGVPFAVRCQVHARGMKGRATLITISDDAQVRASTEARWTSDDERQTLMLEVAPKAGGWNNYLARAEASGGEDAATLSRPITIYAAESRQRVLFFEGEPTWETKFIRRALEEAELFEMDYFAQVSRAAITGVRSQESEAGSQGTEESGKAEETSTREKDEGVSNAPAARLRAALASATRLNAYDCIIVGATPDAMLSGAEAARLRDWVERRGGGLIFLGGNGFAGSIVAPNGKLSALLPALIDSSSFRTAAQEIARNAPVEAEKTRANIPLTPTEAGASSALRGFVSARAGKEKSTAGALTGEGLRLGALRAGASVLAVGGVAGASGTGEAGAPLIAAMRYGAGRTLVFAPADSWRIQASASGEQSEKGGAFASLWQGLTLWAAAGARPSVEIVLNDESPAAGSEVTAELRVLDESYAPLKIEKLNAQLQVEDANQASDSAPTSSGVNQEINFVPDSSDQSIWRARFDAPAEGHFNLSIDYTASGKSGTAQKYFAVVAPSAFAEGASRDTLQRAARETGGDIFSLSNLNALNEKLAALPQSRTSVRRTWDLRNWWPLALIIPLLLSAEWLIQRIKSGV